MKRTDVHRPGAIVPADYSFVFSYNGATSQDGWPVPSFGVNCELDRRVVDDNGAFVKNGEHDADGRCCVIGLRRAGVAFAATGGTCQCSVCGTHFVYGDVWKHEPTGVHIHIGHNCADKYSLLADRSAHELALGRLRQAAATAILKAQNAEERAAFLALHPGLGEALETAHPIVVDIAERFTQYRTLSEKQVALVFKLAHEVANPPPAEVHVPAPEGRVTFRGVCVSIKDRETEWGTSWKITVKVQTPEGSWLAWGTCPDAILSETVNSGGVRGKTLEITATLKRGNDAHFALFSRPRGRVVEADTTVEAAP